MSVMITNIQRMCFDDGPGIRTTVFLKGCSIHCPWCSNPENMEFQKQTSEECEYGRLYGPEELWHVLKKDRDFWGEDGGVTFSGGEPLMQAPSLEEVWRFLKKEKIHIAVETALFVPTDYLRTAMGYVDFFYVDVKLLEKSECRRVLGGDVELYLKNVELLAKSRRPVHFRVPCSEEYVLQEENVKRLTEFFDRYASCPVQIFSIHNLGEHKYRSLGLEPPAWNRVPAKRLETLKRELEQRGCRVEIIRL